MLILAAVPALWLISASAGRSGPPGRATDPVPAVDAPTDVGEARSRVPRLNLARLGQAHAATAPLSIRNPFAFAPRERPSRSDASAMTTAAPPGAPPDPPAIAPLVLIGVATARAADGGIERTALIAGPGDTLHYVREGDTVIARYRVDAILSDGVGLVDLPMHAPLHLTLR